MKTDACLRTGTRLKIVHVITGLSVGGAEMMLYRLLSHLDAGRFETEVISLTDRGPVADRITALGIPVRALGMKPVFPNPLRTLRLMKWLRDSQPDLIQTWMYHADLLGGIAGRLGTRAPVIWNVRNGPLDSRSAKKLTLLTVKFCALLSHWLPTRVICCSEAARSVHAARGYAVGKMVLISNGVDTEDFRPDHEARLAVRRELGISADAPLVGLAARFHPLKGHHLFALTAGQLRTRCPGVQFLLCGDGITWENQRLAGWIDSAAGREGFHLVGRSDRMPQITAAFDAAVSASAGESFPNTVGEAMSCGVPCVVTDVGDAALLVGDTGRVVRPGDPEAMARSLEEIVNMPPAQRARLGAAARERIEQQFSMKKMVDQYAALYAGLAERCAV